MGCEGAGGAWRRTARTHHLRAVLEVERRERDLVELFEADAPVHHLLDEDDIALVGGVDLREEHLEVRVERDLARCVRFVALDANINELAGLHLSHPELTELFPLPANSAPTQPTASVKMGYESGLH